MKGGVYMNINDILTAVTTVGFPIVCCGAMMYYVKYTTDKHREEIETLNTQHKDEMKELTNAVNNNTLALQKLCDKMG